MPRLPLTKETSGYIFIYACDTDVAQIKQHKECCNYSESIVRRLNRYGISLIQSGGGTEDLWSHGNPFWWKVPAWARNRTIRGRNCKIRVRLSQRIFLYGNSIVKTVFYSIIYHPAQRRYSMFPCAEHSDEPQKAEIMFTSGFHDSLSFIFIAQKETFHIFFV